MNQVGGQDELVFDGGSFVVNGDGTLARMLPFWTESLVLTRWVTRRRRLSLRRRRPTPIDEPRLSSVYNAMVLGLRDYVTEEPVSRHRARALGRHRFGADGRGRC